MKCLKMALSSVLMVIALSGPVFADFDSIGFSVKQYADTSGIQLVVTPEENVRRGDRLIVRDEQGENAVSLYTVAFVDKNGDGLADNVPIGVPYGTKHSISIDLAPVDVVSGVVYCGLTDSFWQADFYGNGVGNIEIADAKTATSDEACPVGYFAADTNLRIEANEVIAEVSKPQKAFGIAVLSSFQCQETVNDVYGECVKRVEVRSDSKVSLLVNDFASHCSVTAQVVYAQDRGRTIAGKEEAIRLGGYCPSGYTGIGFYASNAGDGYRHTMSVSSSIVKWVATQVARVFGKKAAKEVNRKLKGCDTSSLRVSLGARIADFVFSLLIGTNACPAS